MASKTALYVIEEARRLDPSGSLILNRRPFADQQFALWARSGRRVKAPGLQEGGFVGEVGRVSSPGGGDRAIMRIAACELSRGNHRWTADPLPSLGERSVRPANVPQRSGRSARASLSLGASRAESKSSIQLPLRHGCESRCGRKADPLSFVAGTGPGASCQRG